jgi:hypothetical protein
MPKVFLFGIKIENKSMKTNNNLLTAKSGIKTLSTEDRNGGQTDGEFLRYDNNNQ